MKLEKQKTPEKDRGLRMTHEWHWQQANQNTAEKAQAKFDRNSSVLPTCSLIYIPQYPHAYPTLEKLLSLSLSLSLCGQFYVRID